ncbi:hypothetical protein [Stieleria neptunia]|nr:hypothetical protein [Stieleria neptunia]
MMKNENENALAHGAGAALLGLLGMFGRCADDVARIGVNSADDIGRACISTSDDFGRFATSTGDDVFRTADDLVYVPETPPRVVATNDEFSTGLHLTKETVEIAIKVAENAAFDDANE